MEGLQFAQILADLGQLYQADNKPALSLLTRNKCIPDEGVVTSTKATLVHEERPKFDRLGRRITSTSATTPTIGAVQRTNSDVPFGVTSTSVSDTSSEDVQIGIKDKDKDLERAKTLMALYKIRGELKRQQSPALTNAQTRVEAVAKKYAQWEAEKQEKEIKEWEAKQGRAGRA